MSSDPAAEMEKSSLIESIILDSVVSMSIRCSSGLWASMKINMFAHGQAYGT